MKKSIKLIFTFVLLVGFSTFFINQGTVKAKETLAVEFKPKAYKVLWNDFQSILDGNYDNRYNPFISWNTIETDQGVATSYSVKVEKKDEKGDWSNVISASSKENSFTNSYTMFEGETYKFTITPRVNSAQITESSLTGEWTVPTQTTQVSPITFNQYVDEHRTVSSLVDTINMKNGSSGADTQNKIYENIMKVYMNSLNYDSLEFINNESATKELLIRAEEVVTPLAEGHYNVDEKLQAEIVQALIDIYNDIFNKKLSVDLSPKTVSVLWGDFADILDNQNFKNVFNPIITWKPIETNLGLADSYKVTIKRLNEDGTWTSTPYGGITETSYTNQYAMNEGQTFEISILPKVGNSTYNKDYELTTTVTVPYHQQQISPVLFKQYTGKSATILSLVNYINIKNSNPNADVTDEIFNAIAKVYVNESYISSLELLNNPGKTYELLNKVEERVTPMSIKVYNPTEALIAEIDNELKSVYHEMW